MIHRHDLLIKKICRIFDVSNAMPLHLLPYQQKYEELHAINKALLVRVSGSTSSITLSLEHITGSILQAAVPSIARSLTL